VTAENRQGKKERRQKEDRKKTERTTRMWANAQRDGHPAEYSWHPLLNALKFG